MEKNPQKPNRDDLGELHPMEIDLILTLRHDFPFGKVEIEMRDGLPQNLLKTITRVKTVDFNKLKEMLETRFRFGEVTIDMSDGEPAYILKGISRKKLGNF